MTTLANSLRRTVSRARALPGKLGLRPHAVELVTKAYPGVHTGDGGAAETWTPISEAGGQPPKVTWLKEEERALGGLPELSLIHI